MTDREILELLLERVSQIDGKVVQLDGKVSGMDGRLAKLEGSVAGMDGRLAKLEGSVAGMDGELAIFDKKIAKLENGQEELKQMVKSIFDQTADLTEFRTETNEKLKTIIENNKSLMEMYGEHEVEIRALKRRPV